MVILKFLLEKKPHFYGRSQLIKFRELASKHKFNCITLESLLSNKFQKHPSMKWNFILENGEESYGRSRMEFLTRLLNNTVNRNHSHMKTHFMRTAAMYIFFIQNW